MIEISPKRGYVHRVERYQRDIVMLVMAARPRDVREVSVASLRIHRRNAWLDRVYRAVFYSGIGALVALATLEAFLPRSSDDLLVFVALYVLGWMAAFNSIGFLIIGSVSAALALGVRCVNRRIIRLERSKGTPTESPMLSAVRTKL